MCACVECVSVKLRKQEGGRGVRERHSCLAGGGGGEHHGGLKMGAGERVRVEALLTSHCCLRRCVCGRGQTVMNWR